MPRQPDATLDELTRQRLARARAYMDAHYYLPLDLDQVCGQASFSRYHFIRLFRRAFDQTPHQYLIRTRIERAKDLLACDGLSVTEVCFAVGFQSLGSFSALFHRAVGQPPRHYRARRFAGWRPARLPIPICFIQMFGAGR
jgi:AraC-like DNA-binding protein